MIGQDDFEQQHAEHVRQNILPDHNNPPLSSSSATEAAAVGDGSSVDQAKRHKQQGNVHFSKKEWQQAIDCYTQAIELNPTDAAFYSNRSMCYLQMGQADDALRDAVTTQLLRPDWSKAYYRIASARLELHRYEDAAVAAFEGLKLDSRNSGNNNNSATTTTSSYEDLKRMLRKCAGLAREAYQEERNKNEGGQEQ